MARTTVTDRTASPASPAAGTAGHELLVIDHAVPAAALLAGMAARPCRVVRLAADADGLAALAMVVEAFGPAAAVHLVGHGAPGRLHIGRGSVTAATLAGRPHATTALATALAGAPLLLYGCAVGAGEAGAAFVAALADALGAPVRASSTPTGAAALGGDWNLDVGQAAAEPLFNAAGAAGWRHLLATTSWAAGTADWNIAGNWDTAAVPTSGDEARIDNGGVAQVTGAVPTLDQVTVGRSPGNSGTLQITGGGALTTDSGIFGIGNFAGSTGTVVVDGAGSTLNTSTFDLRVGVLGTGTLTVSDSGTVNAVTTVSIGNAGSTGTLNIGNGGAAGIVNTATVRGGSGTATLNFNHTDADYFFSRDGTSGGGTIAITDSIAVNHTGTGTTTLTGASSYTGATTVSAGTLRLSGGSAIGDSSAVSVSTGATLDVNDTAETIGALSGAGNVMLGTGTLTVTQAADGTLSGVISESGNLTKAGAGTLTLSGANTYTGTTTVSAGTLRLSGGSAIADTGDMTVATGATLDINDTNETIGALSGAGNVTIGSGTLNTLTVTQDADATFSGVISGSLGNLTKTGASTLTLSGANTYTGSTTVSAGTLSVASDGNLGTGTLNVTGTLQVTGDTTIDNAFNFGAGGGTVSVGADVTLSGVLFSAGGGMTKTGTGTLTLTNTNTYSGATTVSAGTLVVNGTNNGLGTVTVASGATLGGSGEITGAVSVDSGGALTPGTSPGTLSTGNLTLAAGSTATFEIDGTAAGTQYDQVSVTGTVSLAGTLVTDFGFTPATGNSFILIANDGTDAVTGTFSGLAEGATFTSGGRVYRISYTAGDGNDVVLTDTGAAQPAGGGITSGGSAGADNLIGGAAADTLSGGAGDDVLLGLDGADTLDGGDGADILYGNAGADTLAGGADADALFGGQGDDVVYGNLGGDALHGNLGTDVLYGGQGADFLYGNQGDDVLYGGLDADRVFGGQGADVVYGNQGDDTLLGGLGNDTLFGGQGADTLLGGNGNDILFGGAGADTLSGGLGDDLLLGGLGADRYGFGTGGGSDSISGFSADEGDVIAVQADVNGSGILSAADLLARLSEDANGDAVLDLGDGNTVTLIGVPPSGASADWFVVA